MPTAPYMGSLRPQKWDGYLGIRTGARIDGIESHIRQLPRYRRLFVSQTMQDSSLQMPEIRIAMPINVCMPASD